MIIEGGKGSGKTHLMRYLTLTSQLLRRKNDVDKILSEDRYIGIYVRFSGLNASRFKGKGKPDDVWSDVFAYYAELWLGQLLIESILRIASLSNQLSREISEVGGKLGDLLTVAPSRRLVGLEDFLNYLREQQRVVDHAVNNCAITNSLDICIDINRGGLVFDACQVIANCSDLMRDVVFLFLLDEYENLDVSQQRYINTIIREKQSPANFKVGTRSYGIRTLDTLSAGETLVEGSEFQLLRLDEKLRESPKKYNEFCRKMICRRLAEGLDIRRSENGEIDSSSLNEFFSDEADDYFLRKQTNFVISKYGERERPYFRKLRNQILKHVVNSDEDHENELFASMIIDNLRVHDLPIIEKVHAFQFYRAWARRASLIEASQVIRTQYNRFKHNPVEDDAYR